MATVTKPCEQCGEPFEAARKTRKYCGDVCRQRSRRRKSEDVDPDEPTATVGLVEATRLELEQLGRINTVVGAQALGIAERMTNTRETGSAHAALSRELSRVLQLARAGSQVKDPIDEVQRKRDEKRARAREAAG